MTLAIPTIFKFLTRKLVSIAIGVTNLNLANHQATCC